MSNTTIKFSILVIIMTNKASIYFAYSDVNKHFSDRHLRPQITKDKIYKYYMKMYEVDIPETLNLKDSKAVDEYLEKLLKEFKSQGNPLLKEEYQKIIRENKLHTSMMLGDIIGLDGTFYYLVLEKWYKL